MRPDVSMMLKQARHSSPFSSSCMGYKMCIRAYLNGGWMGEKTHLSLFFHHEGRVRCLVVLALSSTLTVINQDNRSGCA